MKYLVIGLGNFGMTLAQTLTDNGHEVIGVDSDPIRIEQIKDRIAFAYIMDATSAVALRSLPLTDIDYAVVAIGQSMDHSLRTVAALKSLNVENIYARALDTVHKSILEAMSISKIFIPESYAAKLFADKLNDQTSEPLL
ncbi:MAG: TrkA family potassium uptake protein [Alistipes sp.]|nr:TrkA family potassium uptake protein [Rikenellaceae bacterium]MBQ7310155.1 TrkA family potassium uptake protein [Alistipes sp.]